MQVDSLVDQFEDFYSILMGVLQWKCLGSSQSSLVESFYGLKRVPLDSAGGDISSAQKGASLAYLIVLPRIMTYLRDASKIIRERARNSSSSVPSTLDELDGLERDAPTDDIPPTITDRLYTTFVTIQESCTLFLANAFPFVEFTGDIAVIAYQLMYLCDRSVHHHPLFALLGMKLEKQRGARPTASSITNSSIVGTNMQSARTESSYSNWPVVIVLSLVLAVRAAEYLRSNNNALEASSLAARLAVPLPVPPVPQPAKIGRGCVVPPMDASLCALCAKTRTNACASNSGYVFCYMCILPYVREHSTCPVTGLFCKEGDIIRLYEESS